VDEVLSVGDEAFQHKCATRMDDLISSGSAVVLVSHNLKQVLDKAHRVLWLDAGRVVMTGEPREVVQRYRDHEVAS
jgi:ABC-type polysaccharide/polyol phosphate transport system ATPase subunit